MCMPFNHKYKSIERNRLQCEKCGMIKNIKCQHEWEAISRRAISRVKNGTDIGEQYICKCKYCGEIKEISFII